MRKQYLQDLLWRATKGGRGELIKYENVKGINNIVGALCSLDISIVVMGKVFTYSIHLKQYFPLRKWQPSIRIVLWKKVLLHF
jgi:hypothetical protein